MKLGIRRRQWGFLFFVLLLPPLVNAVAIRLKIGAVGTLQLLNGSYQPSNPNLPLASLSEILLAFVPMILLLGLLSWLVAFVSNRAFYQKQRLIVKMVGNFVLALLLARVFEITAGFFMPFAWLPLFSDSPGLPGSPFAANWSHWLIFPATAILLFATLLLPGDKILESKNGADKACT